jgi:predicted ATPase/signal transduction histidine kinase/tRNA A-37 threonylcarbamoyl transferase component Bud32
VLGERLQTTPRAAVYRAVRVADGRAVVLKVLDPRTSRPRDVDRLRNEYELGRMLKGLAVIEPLALSSFEGLPALELEDFQDGSLERFVGERMGIDVFLRLAARVAAVVADIHGRGLIHKDLKPGNILLNPRTGELKIGDFCIASRIAREQTTARPARLIEGSLPYVSPEQTGRMNRSIDSRSDLYSLGVTFYELLTGRLPFEAADAIGWVHCHVARRPLPPEAIRADVPPVLADIILRLLAKVPDERYQSASGLAYDLERCEQAWRETGRIAPFPLGERDVSDRFLIPQRLYGRSVECAALTETFARVAAAGTPELALVSGSSGIGKSSVVHELHRPIVARRGVFVRGKFEQYKRDIPYFPVIQAFREIILDILAEPADRIAAWRSRLQAAVGDNGRLVVELLPEVGLVIGPQPPVPELSLSEAENRLRRVLREFLGAFATGEHPLCVFFDDLQWSDPASLKLLVDLVTHPSTRHLLLVGAYRDNEVGPSHPLLRALDEARAEGAVIHTLVLSPLPEAHVSELVADTLHCARAEAEPLAHLVRDKTGGNPFFVIQFLTALHRQGLVFFDREARRWRWDLARIRAEGYTDNVVELMVGKLHDLPAETQEALKLAACLGAGMDAGTLALVFGRDPEVALRAALEDDLLLQVDDAYRFPHDRVQEAAYALIPEGERAAVHLRIGQLLLGRTPPADLEERIFDVVNQLNRGVGLITTREERERLAELDLLAGKRAQRSTAYVSALRYFVTGAEILAREDDKWERRYDLAFELELHRAECELVTRELEAAEQRLAALTERAANPVDAAAVACLQADLYTTSGQAPRAVEACLAYFRRVGIAWSAHPTIEEVREEFARIWPRLGTRSIEELIDAPAMSDPVWRATMDVFTMFTAPASFTDENLCCLAVARAANLSLEHGSSDGAPQVYVLLGEILGTNFDNYEAAFRFGKLGFDMMETRGPLRYKAAVYFCFAQMVNPWTKHFRTSIELQRRSFEAAEQTGNLQTASYTRNAAVTLLLAAGDPLRDVERTAGEGLAFARRARFGLVADIVTTQLRLIRMLRGLTPRFGSLDGDGGGDDFDEAAFERRLQVDPSLAISAGWYWIRKLQARFFALEPGAALDAAARAEAFLWTARAFPEVAEYHFYAALAHAAAHDTASADERPRHLAALAGHHRQLEVWAGSCPENFGNRAALVAAELARLRGDREEAASRYEEAILSARDAGFVHNEAVAYETAARFYRGRGMTLIADTYVRAARDRYLRWGADGKARDLERRNPQLVESRPAISSATVALQAEQLDLLAVVKASQTISGVMVRADLLRTLLRLVLEAGGARRALVLLAREGRLEVAAEVGFEEPAPAPATPGPGLPDSLLAYVQRTNERVLLDDAAADAGRFSADPYLRRVRPRSVLCLPVRRQAEIVALLYLENDLVPGAFTPERLLALELLAAQAAISLENALLLERERAGRVEAEAAERRANLLSEATAIMTSTLDYEGMFGALTRLCVRVFADWAIIDLVEGEGTVRLAGAHRNPNMEPLLRELAERYPAGGVSPAPASKVLTTGAPALVADMSGETLRAHVVDDHHAELVTRLGTGSVIVVPLVARETVIGALSLVSASPGRFGPADVEVAAEIGRRAALAIDNARLMRETQRAVRLRDDFLSVASHELRTPVTSLMITVGRLLRWGTADRPLPPASQQAGLERVKRNTERLRRLTDELLDVTRIEHGRLDLRPMPVDLGALARQVVDDLRFELASAGCATRIDGDEQVVGTWDPSRLEQVITNLITNALKFGPGHPIEIGVRSSGDGAELSVKDHGVGIEPARQPFVFDRFERAVSTTHYGGLGLGLYIAHRIVKAHGGDLRVESEPGHGATFTLTLPWAAPGPAGAGGPASAAG